MSATSTDLALLNARRRRAVQLRVDGLSLTQIQTETGLSVPTIIKACQAFETGGWAAIDVGARGRPKGDGRLLDPEQEADLRRLVLQGPPEAAGLHGASGGGLWDAAALQSLAQSRHGVMLEARALSRLLERWGLALQALPDAATRSAAASAWAVADWPDLLLQARHRKAKLLWAGALKHPDLPAGAGLLMGLSPRGSLQWLPVAKLASADAHIDFMARLLHGNAHHWLLALHGPDLSRAPAITAALSALGRNGVPVYVLYQKGRAPVVLSEILGVDELRSALAAL